MPVERNPDAKPAMKSGTLLAGNSRPVAASIREECGPKCLSKKPVKLHSLDLCTWDLLKLGLHDPENLLHVLHSHQVVYVESESKGTLEAARELNMPHRIPRRNIIRRAVDGDSPRINVERGFEGLLYSG